MSRIKCETDIYNGKLKKFKSGGAHCISCVNFQFNEIVRQNTIRKMSMACLEKDFAVLKKKDNVLPNQLQKWQMFFLTHFV